MKGAIFKTRLETEHDLEELQRQEACAKNGAKIPFHSQRLFQYVGASRKMHHNNIIPAGPKKFGNQKSESCSDRQNTGRSSYAEGEREDPP